MIPAYPKIEQFHSSVTQMMLGHDVVIQEKVDGSQISFGVFDGQLQARSHHQQIDLVNTPKMFNDAVAALNAMNFMGGIRPNVVYRGEYLNTKKHNTLTYGRIPNHNIILFDRDDLNGVLTQCNENYFEVVPLFWYGKFEEITQELLDELLQRESILGGTTIEGVVIKCYDVLDERTGRPIMVKYVSDEFREKNGAEHKVQSKAGIFTQFGEIYGTPARFQKAYQHLKEQGKVKDELSDIGPMIGEVCRDVAVECGEEIKEKIFKWAWKLITRKVSARVPAWYKKKLVTDAMEKNHDCHA
jgi:hypothetical protein